MKKNPLLYLALISSRIGGGLLCLALPLVIGFFVHWHFAPQSYQSVQVSTQGGAISLYEGEPLNPSPVAGGETSSPGSKAVRSGAPCGRRFYLNDLTALSVYTTFIQVVLSICLSLLMVREVIRILRSVSHSLIFTTRNVSSFRQLGWLCLAMFALNSVRVMATVQESSVSFNPGFSLLMFMLAAFIIAEIFDEGYNLSERDRLTI